MARVDPRSNGTRGRFRYPEKQVNEERPEAGLGEMLERRWRHVWPPGLVVLIALLLASALAFGLRAAPVTAKILPVGLDVLALSMILFGAWWRLVALPRWLGGPGSSLSFVRLGPAPAA